MTLPSPQPHKPAGTTDSVVRFDVRIGTGRTVAYQLTGHEFHIGGSAECDLQLPGSHLPEIVCRIVLTADGLRLDKLDPAFPVLLNGAPLNGSRPTAIHNGDRLAIGPADVTVSIGTHFLRPRFVPLQPHLPPAAPTAFHPEVELTREENDDEPDESAHSMAAILQERAELARLRKQLDDQTRELEADRVLWYQRRQEIETELQRLKDAATPVVSREQELSRREQEVLRREEELNRSREDLSSFRQSLFDQYKERRDQIAEMQNIVHGAAESLRERQDRFEKETASRIQELDERERRIEEKFHSTVTDKLAQLTQEFENRKALLESEYSDRLTALIAEKARLQHTVAEFEQAKNDSALEQREAALKTREEELLSRREGHEADRARYSEDLLRLDRLQASLSERQRTLDHRAAEIDERYELLKRDTCELEENVRLAEAEQERLTAESARLDKLRLDLEGEAERLARRSGQLEAQQAMLAVLRARLDRQQEETRREAIQLAADRARQDDSQQELDERLREAERLRAELTTAREDHHEQERFTTERTALLNATLSEIQQQKEALATEHERLQTKETELDTRSAEIAEQTAILKARVTQVMELQERLEMDRTAIRERESTLTDADSARQTFQEQLRRRAEELATRSKQLDDTSRRLHEERVELDRLRANWLLEREQSDHRLAQSHEEWASRATDLDRRTVEMTEREHALERQVARLRDVGRTVAAARKDLEQNRQKLTVAEQDLELFRGRIYEEMQSLRQQAPELQEGLQLTNEKLTSAREVLRGQLGELHAFASQTREQLNQTRAELRAEAERVRDREHQLEKARAEHRLAVSEFRQQLLDWQAKIANLKQTLSRGENRVDAKRVEVSASSEELARQTDELRRERQQVSERRAFIEQHLSDMREWYRKKLRELAQGGEASQFRDHEAPNVLPLSSKANVHPHAPVEDLDPGDRQLGELLRSLELVDAETLTTLWDEARRQRRPLRRVLLASGVITLYQLALIEAGNLDALVLGRFRVIDRVRATSREAVYRVFDPERAEEPCRGIFLLRHLSEHEMEDAVRPDEFRQRFAAARDAAHPNLAGTVEVLEINGRPAVLQEWLTGPPSSDWPATVTVPGVWVKLLASAASALDSAHRAGLVHGRITSESFLLTPEGNLKLIGIGEPPWLSAGAHSLIDAAPETDLRAVGQVAFGWTLLGQTAGKRRGKKSFPESLMAVVRRLDADAETPMADTASGTMPYRTAGDLAADLSRLSALFPCPSDSWAELIAQAAAYDSVQGDSGIRQSA